MRHAAAALKPGGRLLLNVANNAMLLGALDAAAAASLLYESKILLLKPGRHGEHATDITQSEPIFVFAKPAAPVQQPSVRIRRADAQAAAVLESW